MPNQVMHPTLSQLLPFDKIPNEIEAIKDALASIFDDIFVKNLIASQSYDGSAGHYSLVLTTYNSLGINIPIANDLKLVLNPTTQGTTEVPVTFDYSWIILKYIRDFNYSTFDNTVNSVLRILVDLAAINEEFLLKEMLYTFYPNSSSIENFVQDFNTKYNSSINSANNPDLTFEQKSDEIFKQINDLNYQIVDIVYDLVIDINGEGLERLKMLFASYFDDIENRIREVLELNFNATINEISVGLQFPHKWLKPVYTGSEPETGLQQDDLLPDTYFSYLTFNVGSLNYSSKKGFQFKSISSFDLNRSMIGNTGLIAEFQGLKIDLNKDKNIPEADADGRDVSFKGVYAHNVAITLPKKWFKGEDGQTFQISGKRMLVGTGGISGTVVLETENNTPTEIDDFFWFRIGKENGFRVGFNKFDISFKQNVVIQSNIVAALEIPKLKNESGQQFRIPVKGHLDHSGDFNLTASFIGTDVSAKLGSFVHFKFLTLELGKESGDFYVGTSVEVTFPEGIMSEIMGDQKLILPKIRFYSNGKFEIVGGNGFLPVNITLPLGPVDIAVTGIHIGSIQREHHGQMRNYNYVGFDGAISVNPFALDARGEGIKYYYTTDDDEFGGDGDHFLHIQTIEIDLVIPAKSKAVSLHGLLTIPEPGASQEYLGEIDLKIKKGNISGRAAMKLAPKFPAFIVDAEIDLPKPIPLGSFGIYGFRGLIGFRYVAEKKAIKALPPDATWYDYYKYPPKGIHVSKFSGPYDSSEYSNPFSFGAGAVLGTSFDNGSVISLRAMLLLSIPSLFMIEARASIISARLGLTDSKEPPFWAMVAWGDNSIESGMGADFKMPTATGKIFTLNANVESFFPLNGNTKSWYLNIGTREKPNTAIVFPGLINLRSLTYLMLNSQGLEFGSRVDFELKKSFFGIKVKIWAFVEIGAQISFERPQFGGYLHFGGGIDVNVWRVIYVHFSMNAYLSGEAVKPFLIFAELRFKGKIRVARFIKIGFRIKLQLKWEKNREVDTRPVPVLSDGSANTVNRLEELVKGVHMLTNEEFYVQYFENEPEISAINNVIPLDTFIDIKFTKGVVPNAISTKIGGHTSGAESFIDLIPPQKTVRGGHVLRQVKHKYSIENIQIKAWNGSAWVDYHPIEALDPNVPNANSRKIGYWQRSGNQYDTIRLLGGDSFSYVNPGEPGWFTPEQYGITASNLFCAETSDIWHISNVLNKTLGHHYPLSGQLNAHFINGAYFSPIGAFDASPTIPNGLPYNQLIVTNDVNPHQFAQSLSFNNLNGLLILLPEDSPNVELKLTSYSGAVTINYYKTVLVENSSFVSYELAYTVTKTALELEDIVVYENANEPIIKIEIIPISPEYDAIVSLQNQIEQLFVDTYESATGETQVTLPSDLTLYNNLVNQLEQLLATGCSISENSCDEKDTILCNLYDQLVSLGCFDNEVTHSSQFNMNCYLAFGDVIKQIMAVHSYISDLIRDPYYDNYADFYNSLIYAINNGEPETVLMEIYNDLLLSSQLLLTYIYEVGNCKCKVRNCTTSFQEVKWKTVSEYEFELTIPTQEAQDAENEALVESILNTVQPIWRPNTSYCISFSLKDTVNDGAVTGLKNYYYGFKTAGPVGHFHDADGVVYGNEYNSNNTIINRKNRADVLSDLGKLTNPDKYTLTSLRKYLDYKRSYPNVDGNLILSKPMYYENGECKITLNFVTPLAYHMFKTWASYQGLDEVKGALNIQIKDPVTELVLSYPLAIDETVTEIVPITSALDGESEEWVGNNDPRMPISIQLLQNMISTGTTPCNFQIGQPLVPKSYSYSVSLTHLKPQKLYTAIINNAFDVNGDQNDFYTDYLDTNRNVTINENKEVHKFVFQTSRYKNFSAHVMSYKLTEDNENFIDAIYDFVYDFTSQMLEEAHAIVSGSNLEVNQDVLEYTDLFDRIIEGVFKFKPLQPVQNTEFTLLKDLNQNIVGVLVRSSEPFNSPNFDRLVLEDTIRVVKNGATDVDYSVLYSKDYSSCLIMKNGILIEEQSLTIRFKYKGWNGMQVAELANETIIIDL